MSAYKDEQDWDLIIKPKAGLLDLNLKEVWRYRDLLLQFIKRDFVAQYKQTILGPFWHIIQPLLTTLIFLFLFSRVARIGTDNIEPPLVFYMSGITIWNYFSTCLLGTSGTFLINASIFGKVYFPRLVLPLSIVISNIIKFGIQFGMLLIFMIWNAFRGYPIHLTFFWLYIPFLVAMMAAISFGIGIIVSSLTTKYRDLSLLLTFIVQLGMYVTPIAYPLSFVAGKRYEWVLNVNPLTPIVEAFRYCLFGKGTFTMMSMGYSFIFMIAVVLIGTLIFKKVERDFMDTV